MTPPRLNKTEHENISPFMARIEAWVLRQANILMPICLIILVILFVMLCYAICGVSATESGLKYNQFGRII